MAGIFVGGGKADVWGAPLNSMLKSPNGPVGVGLLGVAEEILDLAVAHCPVESEESARAHNRAYEPGNLKRSLHIKRETGDEERGVLYLIGSDEIYARRIEFNSKVGGWLRGAAAAVIPVTNFASIGRSARPF